MPCQHQLALAQSLAGGVQAGQQALRGGFLIAGSSVELPCPVHAADHLAFQRGQHAGGVHTVILDGISRAHDLQVLKPLDGAVHGILHGFRQGGTHPLQVHLLGVLAAGLHKHRVAFLALKAHHLIFNRRAVPRADTLNVPAVQRRAAQIVQDDLVGLRVGVSDVAVHLVVHRLVGHKAERLQQFVRVAGLAVQLAEVNAAAVYAGRGAGLEAAQRHTVGRQILGQRGGRMGAVRAAVIVGFAHKNAPAQRCAGGNHHALAAVIAAQRRYHPAHMAVLHIQPHDLRLVNFQVGGQLQRMLHPHVVALAVSLYAQAVYRGAFAAVQHPALQKGGVRRNAHQAA